jgi:hypothetical protein
MNVDLLVMASSKSSSLVSKILGSTVRRVIDNIKNPVLIVGSEGSKDGSKDAPTIVESRLPPLRALHLYYHMISRHKIYEERVSLITCYDQGKTCRRHGWIY